MSKTPADLAAAVAAWAEAQPEATKREWLELSEPYNAMLNASGLGPEFDKLTPDQQHEFWDEIDCHFVD